VLALAILPKLDELGQVSVVPQLIDVRLRFRQDLHDRLVGRLDNKVLVDRLVDEHVELVVDGVHRIEDDSMEGQQRLAVELLRVVPIGMALQLPLTLVLRQGSDASPLRLEPLEPPVRARPCLRRTGERGSRTMSRMRVCVSMALCGVPVWYESEGSINQCTKCDQRAGLRGYYFLMLWRVG
jgi:hypothetical protein